MVADYLHEQLHWYASAHRVAAWRANRRWRSLLGPVPRTSGGGSRTRHSTRLHLIVNWLEYEALAATIGRERATTTITAKADGPVYPWVYRQVLDRGADIRAVLDRARILDGITLPGPS